VHLPRELQERIANVTQATERLSRELGTSPTPSQIAEDLSLRSEDVIDALEAARAHRAVSLDVRLEPDDENRSLLPAIGAEDASNARGHSLDAIAPVMR